MAAAPFTISGPSDVLAMVPNLFGFVPEDSLVILGVGPGGFHARIDHPRDADEAQEAARVLADAFLRNLGRVTECVVVCYTDQPEGAAEALRRLREQIAAAGVEVVASVRAHGGRWHCLGECAHEGPCVPGGTAYDPDRHPFSAVWVAQGHAAPRVSRADLAESIQADPFATLTSEAVTAAETELDALTITDEGTAERARWAVEQVESFTALGLRLSDVEAAQIIAAMGHHDLRDVVWASMRQRTARAHVALWTDLTRRAPRRAVAPIAGLAAFAAWLSGNGALAWCAVSRCQDADPDHNLGRVVAHALEKAIPPSAWTPPPLDGLDAFGGAGVRAAEG